MRANLQIRIPDPCREQWEAMRPEGQGRYCGSCTKIVVDFTTMSDREMIGYLARAGQGVCGRFAPEQLERDLPLQSPGGRGASLFDRSRRRAGKILLAGLLFAGRVSAQQRPAKAAVYQQSRWVSGSPAGGGHARLDGGYSHPTESLAPVLMHDSLPGHALDSFKLLPPVVVTGYSSRCMRGMMGGLTYGIQIEKTSLLEKLVTDSLTALRLLPKKEITVYPNPVRRGMAVSIAWRVDPGKYELALFNTAGALMRERSVELGSSSQVDLLDIPSSTPAGVYFLKAVRAGDGKEYTRKLVVL